VFHQKNKREKSGRTGLTNDFETSPRTSHKSHAVLTPTYKMTKRPTNLTENEQAKNAPVRVSQNHHMAVNGLAVKKCNA
jgi:hypothetical protein